MRTHFTEEHSDAIVNARVGPAVAPRLRTVMSALVRHLHGFAKDVRLTEAEWAFAIDFLTRVGAHCGPERQEFILLSDALGLSMLVDALNHRRPAGATDSTVFGPFHVDGSPERPTGADICLDGKGERCRFEGRVLDLQGRPVAGARIDVWSDNGDGYYDVQQPGLQPRWNNRGVFTTGEDGGYAFFGIKPVSYPIPHDGPVGQMLSALGRHPWRPAHMHFLVCAEGFERLVTHTFVGDDRFLDSDAVFGVKATLIAPFERVDDGSTVWRSRFDFVLSRSIEVAF
jgi:catechol 1,2-dioxygenase